MKVLNATEQLVHLKMVKMVNFMSGLSDHDKNK